MIPTFPIKPKYFQAFEFIEIVDKISSKETNEVEEPSSTMIHCMEEFLGCLETDHDNAQLLAKAKQCYLQFRDCSGSVILIPDVY